MKRWAIVVCVMAIGATAVAQDAKKEGTKATELKPQTTCPVLEGQKIDKSLYVDYEGKRIYVCCADCLKDVGKNPGKYLKKLESEGVKLEKIQTTCPVMEGQKVGKSLYVDHDGKRIYVCCEDCLAVVKKDPAKYIKKLEDQGITLDKASSADKVKTQTTETKDTHGEDDDHATMK